MGTVDRDGLQTGVDNPDRIATICVERGDIFDGTFEQFLDCFSVEPTTATIEAWAQDNDWLVEITYKEAG